MDDGDEFPHDGPDCDEPIGDSWPVTSAGNAKSGTVRPGEREDVGRSARIVGARVAVIVCAWEEDGLVGREPPTRICMRDG
jgi:hypothetical protein